MKLKPFVLASFDFIRLGLVACDLFPYEVSPPQAGPGHSRRVWHACWLSELVPLHLLERFQVFPPISQQLVHRPAA